MDQKSLKSESNFSTHVLDPTLLAPPLLLTIDLQPSQLPPRASALPLSWIFPLRIGCGRYILNCGSQLLPFSQSLFATSCHHSRAHIFIRSSHFAVLCVKRVPFWFPQGVSLIIYCSHTHLASDWSRAEHSDTSLANENERKFSPLKRRWKYVPPFKILLLIIICRFNV